MIKQSQVNYLEDLALQARRKIVAYSHKTKLPHLGSCLSLVEILIALYFDVANLNEQQPNERTRDRIVLSKGHGAPALFQILAMKGFFSEALLHQDNHGGGLFGEHLLHQNILPVSKRLQVLLDMGCPWLLEWR